MSNSDKRPLKIKDLRISKMPGFADGMTPFDEFSEGINIIAGPNASGKSTTARALQTLVWQNESGKVRLGGHAQLNGDTWTLRVDSGQKISQRNGVPDEINGVPAADEKDRYMLALHTLLTADGKELAKQIIRESVGGYDPEKAAENLGYSNRVSTTGIGVYKEYKRAESAVQDSQEAQKAVKAEEQKLSGLNRQKEAAETSQKKASFYRIGIESKKAATKFSSLKHDLETYPDVLEYAHGEELDRVNGLEQEISDANDTIRKAEDAIDKAEERLSELNIPGHGVPVTVLDELDERAAGLKSAEDKRSTLKAEEKELEKKCSDILTQIGGEADPERLREINLDGVGNLDRFVKEAHRLTSEQQVLQQELGYLTDEETTQTHDPERVREGVSLLGNWLKDVTKQPDFPAWILLSVAVLAIVTAVVGYFVPEAGAAGLVIILALAIYGWSQIGKKGYNQTEQTRISDFRQTGLNEPAAWTAEEVSARLDQLVSDLRDARQNESVKLKIEGVRKRLNNLKGEFEKIEAQKEDLAMRLSVVADISVEESDSYSQMAWYLTAVQSWRNADAELSALRAAMAEIESQIDGERNGIAELIDPFSSETVSDASKARTIYKDLKRQEDSRSLAVSEIDRQKSAIQTARETRDSKQEDLRKVYQKLGLDPSEKDELRRLLEELKPYKKVKGDYELAERELQKIRQSLEEHSLYDEEHEQLEAMTVDQAEAHLADLQQEAENIESLRQEIADIEARVKNVKSGNSLERALGERDQAVENLRAHYDENLQKITGRLLADTIKEEMREQNRPKVFREANRLFNRITKGRYELRMNDQDEPEFLAFDTVEHIGKPLDQLSSGTRIQLLMAVRLAFVETQETSIKLPILADELLANSDDVRAEAIIQALTEISRDGRQVFYFTAQGDEVSKWESYLEQNGDVGHKIFYLTGRADTGSGSTQQKEREPVRLVRNVTEPGLMNHRQYGEALNIAPFNLLTDDPGRLHLWYVIEDPQTLFHALSAGIDYLGALRSYLERGGKIEGMDEHLIESINEKAELLERYLQLYRQGRPRPIDRDVLVESGAVSDSFIEAVTEKLHELSGNPKKLLEALRNSEVSGFRTNKIEELEAYLFDKGVLDDREVLDREELTVALQAFVSNLSVTKEEANAFLKRLTGS